MTYPSHSQLIYLADPISFLKPKQWDISDLAKKIQIY